MLHNQSKGLLILILFRKNKWLIWYTYFISDNFEKISLHNSYEFIFVKHSKSSLYKYYNVNSLEKFTLEPNIYRGWTVKPWNIVCCTPWRTPCRFSIHSHFLDISGAQVKRWSMVNERFIFHVSGALKLWCKVPYFILDSYMFCFVTKLKPLTLSKHFLPWQRFPSLPDPSDPHSSTLFRRSVEETHLFAS